MFLQICDLAYLKTAFYAPVVVMSRGANKTAPMRSLVSIYIIRIHRNRALKYSDISFVCKIKTYMNRKLNVTIFQKEYNDVWEVMAQLVESCLLGIEGSPVRETP